MMMREGIPSIAGSGRHSACIVFITAALLLCVLEAKPLSQEGWGRSEQQHGWVPDRMSAAHCSGLTLSTSLCRRLTGQQKMNQQGRFGWIGLGGCQRGCGCGVCVCVQVTCGVPSTRYVLDCRVQEQTFAAKAFQQCQ